MSDSNVCPKHKIEYQAKESVCTMCGGDGYDPDEMDGSCVKCNGAGEWSYMECPECEAEGHVDD